jgi:hypothetical protein
MAEVQGRAPCAFGSELLVLFADYHAGLAVDTQENNLLVLAVGVWGEDIAGV